jgi:hypothetical protein
MVAIDVNSDAVQLPDQPAHFLDVAVRVPLNRAAFEQPGFAVWHYREVAALSDRHARATLFN